MTRRRLTFALAISVQCLLSNIIDMKSIAAEKEEGYREKRSSVNAESPSRTEAMINPCIICLNNGVCRQDDGGKWMCQCPCNYEGEYCETSFMDDEPGDPTFSPADKAFAGEYVNCSSECDPSTIVSMEGFGMTVTGSPTASLKIPAEAMGPYDVTCEAENTVGSKNKRARIVVMNKPRSLNFSSADEAFAGKSFNCSADGNPPPVVSIEGFGITANGMFTASLKIPKEAKGRHNVTCTAKNIAGSMNMTATIVVKQLPSVTTKLLSLTAKTANPCHVCFNNGECRKDDEERWVCRCQSNFRGDHCEEHYIPGDQCRDHAYGCLYYKKHKLCNAVEGVCRQTCGYC